MKIRLTLGLLAATHLTFSCANVSDSALLSSDAGSSETELATDSRIIDEFYANPIASIQAPQVSQISETLNERSFISVVHTATYPDLSPYVLFAATQEYVYPWTLASGEEVDIETMHHIISSMLERDEMLQQHRIKIPKKLSESFENGSITVYSNTQGDPEESIAIRINDNGQLLMRWDVHETVTYFKETSNTTMD